MGFWGFGVLGFWGFGVLGLGFIRVQGGRIGTFQGFEALDGAGPARRGIWGSMFCLGVTRAFQAEGFGIECQALNPTVSPKP